MSDQSEFETWLEAHIKTWDTELLTKSDCIEIGMNAARDWFLKKANELDKQYIDDNDLPLIFLDDLEEACK